MSRSSRPPALLLLTATVMALMLTPFLDGHARGDDALVGQVVEIVGVGGPIEFEGRYYPGRFFIRARGDRVVLVEAVDPEIYLRGIREVPASWHPEALRAQAVAARTYLAWTLRRGRVGSGAEYGFDICATSACQVYRGGVGEEGAGPWYAAVDDTKGEILVFDGAPAQALYSSTTGGRTRNVEDIFGSTPKPYLQAVASPDEPSPFVRWRVDLSKDQVQAVFAEAGIEAELFSLSVATTDDGEGPWIVNALFSDRLRTWTTWEFRGLVNKHGPSALPDDLPAARPDGRRYPQAVLSPTYTISRSTRYDPSIRLGTPLVDVFSIEGGGWGHDVGMSQYGALAMAESGSRYREILEHYYSGLTPTPAGDHLPTQVVVGLSFGTNPIEIGGDGRLAVAIDGAPVADGLAGPWTLESTGVALRLIPPPGFGVDPGLLRLATSIPGEGQLVVSAVPEWGQVRLVVFDGDTVAYRSDWTNWFGGRVVFAPAGRHGGPSLSVVIQHRDPESGAETVVPLTPGLLLWR